jgi:REP element-mobilizing transposase RayT
MSLWSPAILLVHVVWSTHEHTPRLAPERDAELASHLALQAEKLRCRVVACGNADDHVHVLARLHATVCLAKLVQQLKGATSHDLGRRWPDGLKWQAS